MFINYMLSEEQVFAGSRPQSGQQKLLLALFLDGLSHITSGAAAHHPLRFQEDQAWLLSNDGHWGSFRFCCEIFKLDPSAVRTQVLRQMKNTVLPSPYSPRKTLKWRKAA